MPRVGVPVAHLGDVLEADLCAAERAADVAGGVIAFLCHRGARRRLGLPVPARDNGNGNRGVCRGGGGESVKKEKTESWTGSGRDLSLKGATKFTDGLQRADESSLRLSVHGCRN